VIGFETFWLFLGTSIALALAPGPDILFVITQGVTRGAKAAIALAAGLASGVSVHTTLATLGVAVVFQTSPLAYTILKILGALYLFYLAYQAYSHRDALVRVDASEAAKTPLLRLYGRGFLMNVLNPKVILFFLALFPQFVRSERGAVWAQMAQLGAIFALSAFAVFVVVGVFASRASANLMQNPRFARAANIATAAIFALIGASLALS
jgi:threonine/homoserine/homoserine lactone efflux protein